MTRRTSARSVGLTLLMVETLAAVFHRYFCIQVTIEYENGFIIERTRKRGRAETLRTHQRTTADSAPVYQPQNELGELRNTQKLLNEKLGIDFDTFSKSVVLGQNIFTNFVSGSKEQRRTIIEEMLGLDRFNLYFEAVKQKRQDLEREMEQTQSNREAIEERIGAYQDALEEIQSEIRTSERLSYCVGSAFSSRTLERVQTPQNRPKTLKLS